MPHPRPLAARAALCAAVAALPLPAALATTYDLANVTLNVPTNTNSYTAADTLNTSTVTFTSSVTATLAPALNLVAGTTSFVNTGSLTLTGPLSGSASFLKSGTGTLILTSSSPSFTGPTSVASGSILRLTDPLALGPADAPTPVTFAGTLDVSGSLPARPVALFGGTLLNPDPARPATVNSLAIANAGTKYLTINGPGDITFASPVPFPVGTLNKIGTGTLTWSTPTTFTSAMYLQAGTLRLGTPNPFAGSTTLFVSATATLDLNGFLPGNTVSVPTFGGVIANSSTASPATVTSFPLGSPTFGGAGDIVLNAPAASLAKTGTGTLILNAANTTFAGSISINNGTVRLGVANALGNSTSAGVNLNSTSQTHGTLDLNGLPAPAVSYSFGGGALLNDKPNTTSTIPSSASVSGSTGTIGGAGSIVAATYVPSTLTKVGTGTLTLGLAQSFLTLQINAGTVVLANTGSYQYNTTYVSGGATLDLNGRPSSALTLGLSDDASVVNNNPSSPATIDTGFSLLSFGGAGSSFNLGGAGTLNLASTAFNSKSLTKTGSGTLTFPATFSPKDVTLRQGVLQIHSAAQLGSAPLYFHGGTLRTSPVDLPPQPVYNFTNPWYVYDEGGTIDATADTTLGITGAVGSPLTATTGTLTKTGAGTLKLNSRYQTGVNFTVNQGALSFPPANAPLFARSTLTLNADDAFSCTGSLTGQLTVGALAGSGNLSAVSLNIAGNGATTTYAGTYSSPSLSVSAPAGAFTVTGNLNTNTTVFGSLTLGNGTAAAAGSASGNVNIYGTLSLNRPDSFTLPATLSGTGTLALLGPGATTVTLSPSSSLNLDLQAGQLRLSPTTPASVALTSLALSPTASFDLSTHDVTLTPTTADSLPTLRQYLHTGQLFSSSSDPTHRLAYLDSATFSGEPTAPTSLTVQLALTGDANLDGALNADDYALIDQGSATHGTFWWQGDFNYDGQVDQNDYFLIDTVFGQAQGFSPGFLSQRESQFGPTYVSTLLASIPEPTSLSAACGLALPLLRRRRRTKA